MSGTDGWTRVIIVGVGAALVTWFAGDYIGGPFREAGRQISGDFSGGRGGSFYGSGQVHPGRGVAWQPPFDPFGLRPSSGQDGYASRLPPGVGYGSQGGYGSRGFYGDAGDAYGGGYGYRRGGGRYRECDGPARSLSCRDVPAWGGR